jgi:hypothetical protein
MSATWFLLVIVAVAALVALAPWSWQRRRNPKRYAVPWPKPPETCSLSRGASGVPHPAREQCLAPLSG